jgi:hypothetical protein
MRTRTVWQIRIVPRTARRRAAIRLQAAARLSERLRAVSASSITS